MKLKMIISVIVICLLVAAGLSFALYRDHGPAVTYQTAPVARGSISSVVTANGTVNPVITVLVGSQVSGTIQKLYADYNSHVEKGQLIAQIDPALFQAQVAQSQAKLENARAALLTAQADVANARSNVAADRANTQKAQVAVQDSQRTLKRNQELFAHNLIAASDRDTAQTNYDSAVAMLAAAQAQEQAAAAQLKSNLAKVEAAQAVVKQSQAELQTAQVNLDHTRIEAPVTGMVIARNVDVGQTVAASLQAPTLFTIAQDLAEMQVDTNVSEADVGRIAAGQEATFTVDAFPQTIFRGKVSEIRNAPVTLQNVVTYDVVIQVRNADLKLRPGMTANVSILAAKKDNILMVPNAALRFRPKTGKAVSPAPTPTTGSARVWIIGPNGGPDPVEITPGISDGTNTEVAAGPLQEGQAVITEAASNGTRSASQPSLPRLR